jgi:hypothetical protein
MLDCGHPRRWGTSHPAVCTGSGQDPCGNAQHIVVVRAVRQSLRQYLGQPGEPVPPRGTSIAVLSSRCRRCAARLALRGVDIATNSHVTRTVSPLRPSGFHVVCKVAVSDAQSLTTSDISKDCARLLLTMRRAYCCNDPLGGRWATIPMIEPTFPATPAPPGGPPCHIPR